MNGLIAFNIRHKQLLEVALIALNLALGVEPGSNVDLDISLLFFCSQLP